jgi:glycosyltransferase involved in cell wall biosynthesis
MLTIVCVIDHCQITGGAAGVAIQSSIGLARRGHRVVVVANSGPPDPTLAEAGVAVACLDQPDLIGDPRRARAAIRAIVNRDAARLLSETLASCPPTRTIVHVHGWAKGLSPIVGPVIRRSGVVAVHTLHDYFSVCPNGALFDYQASRNCVRKPLSAACLSTHCDSRRYAHKLWRTARHAAMETMGGMLRGMTLICLSDLQRRVIEPLLPPGSTLHYVPNPVAMPDLGPAPVAGNDSFLFIGRLSREKGADLLAAAAARTGQRAVFIGDGPIAETLRAAAPDARLMGWLPPDRVVRELRRARALVFPSIWYETFGLVVYEALAAGVPVICGDNNAGREAIRPGENGLLFAGGDVDDLARQMRRLADPAAAAVMGTRAHELYWGAPYSLDRHLDALEEVYADAHARHAGRCRPGSRAAAPFSPPAGRSAGPDPD